MDEILVPVQSNADAARALIRRVAFTMQQNHIVVTGSTRGERGLDSLECAFYEIGSGVDVGACGRPNVIHITRNERQRHAQQGQNRNTVYFGELRNISHDSFILKKD